MPSAAHARQPKGCLPKGMRIKLPAGTSTKAVSAVARLVKPGFLPKDMCLASLTGDGIRAEDVCALLLAAPSLHTLRLDRCTAAAADLLSGLQVAPRLRSLTLRGLCLHPTLPPELAANSDSDVDDLPPGTQSAGPTLFPLSAATSLTALDVSLGAWAYAHLRDVLPPVSQLPHLQSLSLSLSAIFPGLDGHRDSDAEPSLSHSPLELLLPLQRLTRLSFSTVGNGDVMSDIVGLTDVLPLGRLTQLLELCLPKASLSVGAFLALLEGLTHLRVLRLGSLRADSNDDDDGDDDGRAVDSAAGPTKALIAAPSLACLCLHWLPDPALLNEAVLHGVAALEHDFGGKRWWHVRRDGGGWDEQRAEQLRAASLLLSRRWEQEGAARTLGVALGWDLPLEGASSPAGCLDALRALAPLDGKLRHLGLRGFAVNAAVAERLAVALPCLSTLTLTQCMPAEGSLVALVRALPCLQRLNLEVSSLPCGEQHKQALLERFGELCRGTDREFRVHIKGVAFEAVLACREAALSGLGSKPPKVWAMKQPHLR